MLEPRVFLGRWVSSHGGSEIFTQRGTDVFAKNLYIWNISKPARGKVIMRSQVRKKFVANLYVYTLMSWTFIWFPVIFHWAFILIQFSTSSTFTILSSKSFSKSESFPSGCFEREKKNHKIKYIIFLWGLHCFSQDIEDCSCLSFMNHSKDPSSILCLSAVPRFNSSLSFQGHLLSLWNTVSDREAH